MLISPDFPSFASLNMVCSPCAGCIVLLESLAHGYDSCNSNILTGTSVIVAAGTKIAVAQTTVIAGGTRNLSRYYSFASSAMLESGSRRIVVDRMCFSSSLQSRPTGREAG